MWSGKRNYLIIAYPVHSNLYETGCVHVQVYCYSGPGFVVLGRVSSMLLPSSIRIRIVPRTAYRMPTGLLNVRVRERAIHALRSVLRGAVYTAPGTSMRSL